MKTVPATRRPPWHYGVPVAINFGSVLISFCSSILLARLIGPAAFGIFAIWLNNVQLFGTLGMFGQQNYVLRELAHHGDPKSGNSRRIAYSAIAVAVAAASAFGLAGAGIFALFQDGPPTAAILQWGATILFALLLTLSAVHRGLGSLTIGILFDRLVYQLPFLGLIAVAGGAMVGAVTPIAAFTAFLAVAAAGSIVYLVHIVGIGVGSMGAVKGLAAQIRPLLPFFVLNCLFVVNARYMLTYAGIFLEGSVLGQVGLVFTVVGMLVIPISTLNLLMGPFLARRLQRPDSALDVVKYLVAVTALVMAGIGVVYFAHPLIFMLADIEQTVPSSFIMLLCGAFAITLLANAALIVQQFRGQAARAARLFSAIMAVKLVGGYVIGQQFGVTTLFVMDLLLGLLFALLLISQMFTDLKASRSTPGPTDPPFAEG